MFTKETKQMLEDRLQQWFDRYVPAEGQAGTVGGELVRATERLLYRWWNDGDQVGVGYGNETCNSSYRFIAKYVDIESLDDNYYGMSDDDYEEIIWTIAAQVVGWLDDNITAFTVKCDVDSREPSDEDFAREREQEGYDEEEDDYYDESYDEEDIEEY